MNKIIEKIQKLIKLATNNTNAAEMEAAMAKAIQIATENDIDIASIEIKSGKKNKEEFVKETVQMGQRLPVTHDLIRAILRDHFKVKIIMGGNRQVGRYIHFIGVKEDIEMAKFVSSFLSERFMGLWHNYFKRSNCPLSGRQSFFMGLYEGLDTKLTVAKQEVEKNIETEIASGYALMVINRKEELAVAVKNFFPSLTTIAPKKYNLGNQNAYSNGFVAGTNLNIARPLGNG